MAASQLAGKLAQRFGRTVPCLDEYGLIHLFPSASDLAIADLTDFGMPAARISPIIAFSRAFAEGVVDLYSHDELPELLTQLERIPGIGPWTSNLIALRVIGHLDAFPAGDIGLQRAAGLLVGRARVSGDELANVAEQRRSWRGLAASLLWTERGRAAGAPTTT